MAHWTKATEHSGAKKGQGAYWGRKRDAKEDSNHGRRENDKVSIEEQLKEEDESI